MYQVRYGTEETLAIATTAKLVRNLMMGGLVPLVAVMHHRRSRVGTSRVRGPVLAQVVPLFIVGFVLMAALRTLGDMGEKPLGFLESSAWVEFLKQANGVSAVCLTLAMASIGLGTDLKEMRQLGIKPLILGLIATLIVCVCSGLLISLLLQGGSSPRVATG